MIKPEIAKAINQQINQELVGSYAYLAMSTYFEYENLSGFAHWCMMQHDEERLHAMRLIQYLLDRGGRIEHQPIAAPQSEFTCSLAVFKLAMAQEEANTHSINELYSLASAAHDHATISHLQWFVDEQVEEEKSVGEILSLVERAQNDVNAMLYLNDRLAQRPQESAE
jgi:ferritin